MGYDNNIENKLGGAVCSQRLGLRLLPSDPRPLTSSEIDGLWTIFVAIGTAWRNTVHDSIGQKSSWLEFVNEKTNRRPSYAAEYVNALEVIEELTEMYPEDGFKRLFFESDIPPSSTRGQSGYTLTNIGELPEIIWRPSNPADKPTSPLDTRLAHAKIFVVDEFIRVQIIAGGFKNFIRPENTDKTGHLPDSVSNYNGFIAASRFNRLAPVRQKEGNKE